MWNREYNWFLIHDIRQSSYKDRCTYDDNPWKRSKASSRGVLSGNLQAGSIVRIRGDRLKFEEMFVFSLPSLKVKNGRASWRRFMAVEKLDAGPTPASIHDRFHLLDCHSRRRSSRKSFAAASSARKGGTGKQHRHSKTLDPRSFGLCLEWGFCPCHPFTQTL